MTSWGYADWKKIGWHIGKKIKDILYHPPANPEESKEERKARRLRDGLKGFVYFDDFDELLSWLPQDVDPVQQANTPLLDRAAVHDLSETGVKVLLCHDYSGGYHDYESVRPVTVELNMYTCDYLQYTDLFIYFSHKLVCVPPPTWINTMHRNGVAILGTFILEPQTPDIEQLLERVDGEFVLAKKLATLALIIGFDGWLLNFEKEFPDDRGLVRNLVDFISQLRHFMGPQGRVIWYDALNIDNEVKFQNSLTHKNLVFSHAASGLFTNYKWTEEKIHMAAAFAAQHSVIPSHVYFGIDVWAQNTNMLGPPRITFPPKGGGGTNTGLAVKEISHQGFAAAIFAPAWPYEHFSTSLMSESVDFSSMSVAKAVDKSMWEGTSLPNDLKCDCLKGRPHHVADYRSNPIIKYAQEHPAGSSKFFHTDFQGAFRRSGKENSSLVYSALGSQNILPHLLPVSAPIWEEMGQMAPARVIYGELDQGKRPYLRIMTKMLGCQQGDGGMDMSNRPQTKRVETKRLQLFKLNMPADESLEAKIEYQCNEGSKNINIGFFTAYTTGKSSSPVYKYQPVVYTQEKESCEVRLNLEFNAPKAQIVGIGAYYAEHIKNHETLSLISVFSITIKNKTVLDDNFKIEDIRIVERRTLPKKEKRLAWSWQGSRERSVDGVPWSRTTGPFSHFIVMIDQKEMGTAYCLEFPLCAEDGRAMEVFIEGVLFDGKKIKSATAMIAVANPHDGEGPYLGRS